LELAKTLKKEGILEKVEVKKEILTVIIKYHKKEPILIDLKLVSKPGLRIYMGVPELLKKRGASTYIISTPQGILSTKDAIKKNLGGEVIAEIT